MIYLASDHGGFTLKETIKIFLTRHHFEFEDLGPAALDLQDDYPDFARLVAERISQDPAQTGILFCRSGQGVNIVANKFKNTRAALVWNAKEAVASRTDDLANIISLPTDYISAAEAERAVAAFLQTPPGDAPRHVRRVGKIGDIERMNFK